MSFEICRKRLAVVWYSLAGILFMLVLAKTITYEDGVQIKKLWNWFVPTIVPTLTLMITALKSTASGKKDGARTADVFLYRLTIWLSIVYLVTLLCVLVLPPTLAPDIPQTIVFDRLSIGLGVFQGIVTAALGAFFIKK